MRITLTGSANRLRATAATVATMSLLLGGAAAATTASAEMAGPYDNGYCAPEYDHCYSDTGGPGAGGGGYDGGGGGGGGGGGYGDGGGGGGGGFGDGGGSSNDNTCGGSRNYLINGVAWIRRGKCASHQACLGKAYDINRAAESHGNSTRAVCGSSGNPHGSGRWLWTTSVDQ